MAAFAIHEEMENIPPHQKKFGKTVVEDKENRVKKTFLANQKSKLQPLECHVRQETKRVKLSTKENVNNQVVKQAKNETEGDKPVLADIGFLKIQCDKPLAVKEKDYFPETLLYSDEYRQEIWQYLKELEITYKQVRSDYMQKQAEVSWSTRSVLIDWLATVAEEYKFGDETFHLAVGYIDRFLSQISVIRSKFQLVGAAAMMVATKMEEYYPLDSKEWSYLTGDSFSPRQVMKMEHLILKVLRFRTQPPTINRFIQQMCTEEKMDEKVIHMAMYISDLVLLEGEDYLNHYPSKLAASAIVLARYLLSKKNPWPTKLKQVSGYTLKELSPVVEKQHKTFKDSPLKNQQAIQTKYSSPKFNRVATMKPRVLKLDELKDDEADFPVIHSKLAKMENNFPSKLCVKF